MTGEHAEEIEELLGAYALDAVDEDERERVERHLVDCPRCRLEVEQHREVAAQLAYVGAPAPDGLWDRIVGQLEEAPPALDLAPVVPMAPMPVVDPRRRRRARALGGLAAAAVALVVALLGFEVARLDHRVGQLAADRRQAGIARDINAAFLAPGATRVSLRGSGSVDALLLPNGTGYVVRSELPTLGAGRTYQLWAIVGSTPVSLGLLGSHPGEMQFNAATASVSALAITAERAGGVATPTLPPVVSGAVTLG